MIKLSIIIPHYNDAERLNRCLKSIPNLENIEVIVVDDNSPMDSQRKAKEYTINHSKQSFFLINPSENHSAGACRNIGLDKASGKWIMFSDADDFFSEGWYEKVEKYFLSEYDYIHFMCSSVSDVTGLPSNRDAGINRLVSEYADFSDKDTEMHLRSEVTVYSRLINRDFLKRNAIRFEEIRYSNDVMFSTFLGFYAQSIIADKNRIYVVTDSEGTLTKIHNVESFNTRKQALLRRHVFWLHNLSKEDFKRLKLETRGYKFVLSPIKNGYGVKTALFYLKLIREERIPLF